jgi:hypothetical protein
LEQKSLLGGKLIQQAEKLGTSIEKQMLMIPEFLQPEDLFVLGKSKQRKNIYCCPYCLAPMRSDNLKRHMKAKHPRSKGKYNNSFDFLDII